MDSFEFESGEMIDDAVVEYMTFGTPKYDENGAIDNAILYCSGSLGTFAGINKILPLTEKGDAFDGDEYFFISMSALGAPGSCSPSTTRIDPRKPAWVILISATTSCAVQCSITWLAPQDEP